MRVWRTFLGLAKANAELGGALVDRLVQSDAEARWRRRAEALLHEAVTDWERMRGNGHLASLSEDWITEAGDLLNNPPGTEEEDIAC